MIPQYSSELDGFIGISFKLLIGGTVYWSKSTCYMFIL